MIKLLGADAKLLRFGLGRILTRQLRNYSLQSDSKNVVVGAPLPNFTGFSSRELELKFGEAREKILVPGTLSKAQFKYASSDEYKDKWHNSPMILRFGDAKITLKPISVLTDLPTRRTTVREIMRQSRTADDWKNLAKLFQGINYRHHRRGRNAVPVDLLESFVRRGLELNFADCVLKSVQHARSTGLSMRRGEILFYLMNGLREMYLRDEYAEENLEKFIVYYERVLQLMDSPYHFWRVKCKQVNLSGQPWTLGPLIEILGIRLMEKWDKEIIHRRRYEMYLERLMSMLEVMEIEHMDRIIEERVTPENRAVLIRYVKRWEPVYNALDMSVKLVNNSQHDLQVQGYLTTLQQGINCVIECIKRDCDENVKFHDNVKRKLSPESWQPYTRWTSLLVNP